VLGNLFAQSKGITASLYLITVFVNGKGLVRQFSDGGSRTCDEGRGAGNGGLKNTEKRDAIFEWSPEWLNLSGAGLTMLSRKRGRKTVDCLSTDEMLTEDRRCEGLRAPARLARCQCPRLSRGLRSTGGAGDGRERSMTVIADVHSAHCRTPGTAAGHPRRSDLTARDHRVKCTRTPAQTDAQLSQRDRAMRYVRRNLVNCCTTAQKIEKACNTPFTRYNQLSNRLSNTQPV